LTQVGGAVGTPKYMSPEQARGLRGDSRSDLFSAAVVLYELLTGTLPFTGDNQFIVIHQIVSQDAKPPSSLNPEVPAALDDVLARAMAKNPDERYATARDFAVALRSVAQQMNASPAAAGGDVAAELGQFLANRPVAASSALRDGSSTGIFGPSLEAALNTTVNHEAELGAWNAVRDSTNAQDFLKFLASFPAGIYARRAQNRVYQLGAGDALQDAKTEPQYRSLAGSLGFESTVGYNDVTRPSQSTVVAAPEPEPEPEQPLVLPDLALTIAATPEPKVKGRRVWLLIAGASVLFCLVALFLNLNTDTLVPQSIQAVPALPVEPVASVPVAPSSAAIALPVAPALAASAASAALQASAPKPASKPKAVSSAASAPAEPVSASGRAAPVKPPPREAAPAGAIQGQVPNPQPISGPGPSMSGQVCEDRVFIFKITCIAAQCQTDRYRHTAECVQFKEMEREREEQQRNSRR
jgi:hypothetical protein